MISEEMQLLICQSRGRSLKTLLFHAKKLFTGVNPPPPKSADNHLCDISHLGSSLLGLAEPDNSKHSPTVTACRASGSISPTLAEQHNNMNNDLSNAATAQIFYSHLQLCLPFPPPVFYMFCPQPRSTD